MKTSVSKRLISFLLMLCMVLTILPGSAFARLQDGGEEAQQQTEISYSDLSLYFDQEDPLIPEADGEKTVTLRRGGNVGSALELTLLVYDNSANYAQDYQLYYDGELIPKKEGSTSVYDAFRDNGELTDGLLFDMETTYQSQVAEETGTQAESVSAGQMLQQLNELNVLAASIPVTFPAGESAITLTMEVLDDELSEYEENILLAVLDSEGEAVEEAQLVLAIEDNEESPTVTVVFDCEEEVTVDKDTELAALGFRRTGDLATSTTALLLRDGEALGYVDFAPHQDYQTVWAAPGIYTLGEGYGHYVSTQTVTVLNADGTYTVPEGADPLLDAIPNSYASLESTESPELKGTPSWFPEWAKHTSTVETYDYIAYMGSTSNNIYEQGKSSGVGRWKWYTNGNNEHCVETDGTGSRCDTGWRNVYTRNKYYEMAGIESLEITVCIDDLDYSNKVIIGFHTTAKEEIGRTTKDNSRNEAVTVSYTLPANYQGQGYVFVENKDPSIVDDGCNMYIPNGFKANKRTYRFVIGDPEDLYYRGIGNVEITTQNNSDNIFTKMGSDNPITIAYQVEGDLPVKLIGYHIVNMSTEAKSDIIPISGSSFTFNQQFLLDYEKRYCANTQHESTSYPTFKIIPVFEKIPVSVELEPSELGTITIDNYSGERLYVGERITISGYPVVGTAFAGVYYKNYKSLSSSTFDSGTVAVSSSGKVTYEIGRYDHIVLQGDFRNTVDKLIVNYAETDSSKRHGKLAYNDGTVLKGSEYVKGDYFPLIADAEDGYVVQWYSDGRIFYGDTYYYQLDANSNHNWISVDFIPEGDLEMKTQTITGTLSVLDTDLRTCTETAIPLSGNQFTCYVDNAAPYTGTCDENGNFTIENFTGVEDGIYSMMVIYRDTIGYVKFVPFPSDPNELDLDLKLAQFASGSIYPSDVNISLGYVTESHNVVQVGLSDTGEITVEVTNQLGDKGTVQKVQLHFLSNGAEDYGNELTVVDLAYNEQLTQENDSEIYSYWTYNITDPSILPLDSRMYVSVTAEKEYIYADDSGRIYTDVTTINSGLVNSGYDFIAEINDSSIPVQQSVPDIPGATNAGSVEDGQLDIPLIGSGDFSITSLSGGYFVQRIENGTTYLICGHSLAPVYGVGTLQSKYEGAVQTHNMMKDAAERDARSVAGSSDMESILLGNGNYTPQPTEKKKSSNWALQPVFMMKIALTSGTDSEGNSMSYVSGFEIALGFDAFYRQNIPFSVYGVPFYICFAVSLEAFVQGQFAYTLGSTPAGSDMTMSLYSLCSPSVENVVESANVFLSAPMLSVGLKAGIGYNCFLGVYVDGSISMPIMMQFEPDFDVGGEFKFSLAAGADLAIFSASIDVAEPGFIFGNHDLYDDLTTIQGFATSDPTIGDTTGIENTVMNYLSGNGDTPSLTEMLDNLSFSLMERPENGTNLLRAGAVDSETLAENVFKNTNIQFVQLGNGNIVALFLEDNGEAGLNYLSAVYAVSKDGGETWSDINFVNNNIAQAPTSLQFDINVYQLRDRFLVTWSEADFDTLLSDADVNNLSVGQIAEALNAMNLRGRFYDANTGEALSEAFTIAEHSTVACGALDAVQNGENVYVYYQRNSFPTAEETTVSDIMSCESTFAMAVANVNDPSNWVSSPVRAENDLGEQYRITEVVPFVHDGVMGEVIVLDRNGRLVTLNEEDGTWVADNEDRQLFLRTYDFDEDGAPVPTALLPITPEENCAQSPQVVSNEDHLHLFWNENGEIVYLSDFIATYEDHEDIQASAILLRNSDGTITVVDQECTYGDQIIGSDTLHIGTTFSASMAQDGNVLLCWIYDDQEEEVLIAADEIYGVILNTVTNAEALARSGNTGDADEGNENVYQLWAVGAPIALTDEDSLIGALDTLCLESGKDNRFLLAFSKLNATARSQATSAEIMVTDSVDAPDVSLDDISAPAYPLPGSDMSVLATVTNNGLEPLNGFKVTASGIGETVITESAETVYPGESAVLELTVTVPEDFSAETELRVDVCGLSGQEEYADFGTVTICYGPYFALDAVSKLISVPNSTDCEAITCVRNIGNAAGQPTLTFTNTIFGSDEFHQEYVFESDETVQPGEEVTLTYVLEDTLMNVERNAQLVVATGDNYDQRKDSFMPAPVFHNMDSESEELPPIEEVFTDVEGHWAKDAIEYVYREGLMNGMSENTFEPDTTTSRAMLVTVLYRMTGEPEVTGENPYTDVLNDTWYTDAIIWASEKGIAGGYGGKLFGPDDPVTREQMATIFYRYAGYVGFDTSGRADLSGFADYGKISDYALEPLAWANAVGLIYGVTEDTICPLDYGTRAQVATILRRYRDLPLE